jgi:hypothetical protein
LFYVGFAEKHSISVLLVVSVGFCRFSLGGI